MVLLLMCIYLKKIDCRVNLVLFFDQMKFNKCNNGVLYLLDSMNHWYHEVHSLMLMI